MREDSRSARRNFPIFADKFPAIPGRLLAEFPAICLQIYLGFKDSQSSPAERDFRKNSQSCARSRSAAGSQMIGQDRP